MSEISKKEASSQLTISATKNVPPLSRNKRYCNIYHVQLHQLYIGRTALWFDKILTFNHIWWQRLYIKILSKLFWMKLTFEHVLEKSNTLLHVHAIVLCLYIHCIISSNHLTTCTLIYPIQSKHTIDLEQNILKSVSKSTWMCISFYHMGFIIFSVNCL